MRISRRAFVLAVPAAALALPASARPGIVERRIYATSSLLPARELLHRNGMNGVEIRRVPLGFEYLLRFDSWEARVRAWDRVNTDPEWCALRAQASIDLRQLSLVTDSRA